jgi:hypothetical protein
LKSIDKSSRKILEPLSGKSGAKKKAPGEHRCTMIARRLCHVPERHRWRRYILLIDVSSSRAKQRESTSARHFGGRLGCAECLPMAICTIVAPTVHRVEAQVRIAGA